MKKILLTGLLALGFSANAQFNYTGGFEETTGGLYGQFGGGTITTAAACTGTYGGQLAISASVASTGWMLMMDGTGQVSNGQKVDVTYSYKKAAGAVGSLYLAYFVYDEEADSWSVNTIGTAKSLTNAAITTCTTITGTVPAGVAQPGQIVAFGAYFVRTSGSGNIYIDDIIVKQEVVTTAPACTTISAPVKDAVVNYGGYELKWSVVPTASNYKVTVGTAPGAKDAYEGTIDGNVTSQFVPLKKNTNYYLNVVALNNVGSAVGCQEIPFKTNAVMSYCAAAATSTQYEKISNVTFAGINNNSTSTAGYEDFTSISGDVKANQTYPISVTVKDFDSDKTSVWIDYNQDGVFSNDEKVDLTSTATATGNIKIPATAINGKTRMRVRMTYGAALPAPCGSNQYGQVEDYSINITEGITLAVNDINKINVSVYPNPFKDVLKISDIKDAKAINVADASGRVVATPKVSQELNLSSLGKGVYFVTVSYENGSTKSFKVIKE